jgi:hypothetical protein
MNYKKGNIMNTEFDLTQIQPGDVILTQWCGFEISSLGIKLANFFKRGYAERGWTHSALSIGEGKIVEALTSGIKVNDISEEYLQGGKYNLLILRHKKRTPEGIQKAIDFCKKEKGDKYNFWGLGYFVLCNFLPENLHFILDYDVVERFFKIKDSYFCSELVSTGFQKGNIYCFERLPYKVMPIDFYNPLWFDTIGIIGTPPKENKLL